MKAYHAIFEEGYLNFQFKEPDYKGPAHVIVVFPDMWDDIATADLEHFDPEAEEVPF